MALRTFVRTACSPECQKTAPNFEPIVIDYQKRNG